jgi:membrane protease YdiL (CAAX protease family)
MKDILREEIHDFKKFLSENDISKPSRKEIILVSILSILTVIVIVSSANILSYILEENVKTINSTSDVRLSTTLFYIIYMYIFVAPVEEFVFRKIIQRDVFEYVNKYLNIKYPSAITRIIITSSIFGAAHIVNTHKISALLAIGIGSIIFGFSYEYTDNLTVPILIHATYNSMIILLVVL